MPDITELLETEEQSEEQYETTDGKPYAADFSNLAEDRVAQLRKVCDAMDMRDQWARLMEIIRCTLRRYFLIGQQHPYWDPETSGFRVGPSGVTMGDENENNEEFFEESFNIYRGYHDVFAAVFSQTAAPTRVEPVNMSAEAVRAAKEAEKYVEVYEKYNPPKVSQLDVASLMWTDGRITAVTEYKEDEESCGVDENGQVLGAEMTEYFGVLETKCPIVGKFAKWPYIKVSRDMDVTVAKDENPHIASKIETTGKGQVANNEIARISRISVAEGIAEVSSDTLAYLVTEDRWWLRKSAFHVLDKKEKTFWIGGSETLEDGTKREVPGLCPEGLACKFIGTVFAGIKLFTRKGQPISALDAQIRVMHSNPGTGNARGSKSDGLVPIQMEFNDGMNSYIEMINKCIPHTWLNTEPANLSAITKQFSRYGEFGAFQPANGLGMSDNIFQEAQIDVPASFPMWMQNLQGPLAQQVANIQPAMFGGDMEDQKTAKAYQQARDMSMGVMSIVWVPYLEFKSGICWQAARLAAERDAEKITAVIAQKDGKSKSISIDTGVLGRGAFICKPVTDQNFPESHTDIANKWLGLFQVVPTNPVAQLLFQEPDNLAQFKDATGLEIVIKGAAARDKQLSEWGMMQAGSGPVPDVMGAIVAQQDKQQQAEQLLGGQAPPVPPEQPKDMSSVPIRLADDHIEEARTCVRILNDSKTLEMLVDKPEIVKDLELHLTSHLEKAQASGIMIPPDLIAILPPMPLTMPGMGAAPIASGAAPPAAGGPEASPKPKPSTPNPAATGPVAPPLVPSPLGGNNNAALPA